MKREARAVLSSAGIALGQAFDSLNTEQLKAIGSEAAMAYSRKHGKPMPDDCRSYIRKRFDLLQRRARLTAKG